MSAPTREAVDVALNGVFALVRSLATDAAAYDVEVCMRNDGRAELVLTLCRTGLMSSRHRYLREADGRWYEQPLYAYGRGKAGER